MKIDKDLVIDFEDIIGANWNCPTYNNQTFYETNQKRLRYKINELDDEYYKNNKFYQCFDTDTLEILKPREWEELSKMSGDEMDKLVTENNWDWIGDDFDDMVEYLDFIMKHKPNLAFTTKIADQDEYMDIFLHDFTDRFKSEKEKQAFISGLNESGK